MVLFLPNDVVMMPLPRWESFLKGGDGGHGQGQLTVCMPPRTLETKGCFVQMILRHFFTFVEHDTFDFVCFGISFGYGEGFPSIVNSMWRQQAPTCIPRPSVIG